MPHSLLVLFVVACAVLPARAQQVPGFDQERAWQYLLDQVEFGPRAPGTPGHQRCGDWLIATLKERADKVQPHTFVIADPYSDQRLQLTNIRASFRPELTDRIALAAHWDTRPRADMDEPANAHLPILGANDGASGVAVLLAVADALQESPPPVGVDLLLFDGEDWGKEGHPEHYLLGSRRFVRDFPQYRPRALILVDLVGDADLEIPMEGYSLQAAPELTRMVFDRAQALGLPAFVPVRGRAVLDDHVPFLQARIPAVNLIDFDYPHWHKLSDTPEHCSPESLGQVGTLLLHLVFTDFAPGSGGAAGVR